MVFQPRTVTYPHLGSVAINYKLYIYPSRPTCFYRFSGLFFTFLHPTAPPSASVHCCSPLSVCTCSSPPFLAGSASHLDAARTCHPPAPAALLCALRCMPASATVSCDHSPPPLPPSACIQAPVGPWGVWLSWVPLSPLFFRLALLEFSSKSLHILVLGFLLSGFSREGERPGRLHSPSVDFPVPCSPRYLVIPELFSLPLPTPSPSLPCRLDPIPVGRKCGV